MVTLLRGGIEACSIGGGFRAELVENSNPTKLGGDVSFFALFINSIISNNISYILGPKLYKECQILKMTMR